MDNKCEQCGMELVIGMYPFCKGNAAAHGMGRIWTQKTYPFTTKMFNGQDIEVTDANHERQLMREHGVVKRDDAAWIDKSFEGFNPRTGRYEYHESSGVGNPGCWI